jgi:hypothetical protein
LASSCFVSHACLRHADDCPQSSRDGGHPPSGQSAGAQKNYIERETKTSGLIRWSIQEIHQIAQRLARKRIQPAYIIAWSLWRPAHQAAAQKAHFKRKSRL